MGAVCGKAARTDLGGGREVTRVPTAKRYLLHCTRVGKRLAAHHQTVQCCVERAVAYGALAALDDRPRPGKEPTITPEAKAWLVSLACDKAKEHGYWHLERFPSRLKRRPLDHRSPSV